jgi:hypothetical protein
MPLNEATVSTEKGPVRAKLDTSGTVMVLSLSGTWVYDHDLNETQVAWLKRVLALQDKLDPVKARNRGRTEAPVRVADGKVVVSVDFLKDLLAGRVCNLGDLIARCKAEKLSPEVSLELAQVYAQYVLGESVEPL